MVEAREDVERIFMIDRLPAVANPFYDHDRGAKVVPFIQLREPWNTEHFLIEELRADVVHSLLEVRRKLPPLDPFTLVRAHEAMANRDVPLASFLIHPDFTPLCEKLVRPMFGIEPQLFAHHEVPYAEIYAMCAPDYLGVIPVSKGRVGAYRFSENVVWGRFKPRAGV